jgi:hypothetical protein
MGFLRGSACFLLIALGTAIFFFSVAVASGWDKGPLSILGTLVAMLGVSLIFAGFWLARDLEGAPIAAVYLKVILGLGSVLLVVGLLALIIRPPYLPTGYFVMTGGLSTIGFFKFRGYTSRL